MQKFIAGLKNPLKWTVKAQQPKTLRQAYEVGIECRDEYIRYSEREASDRQTQNRGGGCRSNHNTGRNFGNPKQQNNNRNDSQERRYNNQQRDENRNAYYGPQPFKRGRFFEQSQDRSRQGSVSSATSTYSGRTQTTNNGRNTYNPQTELHNIEEVPNFTIAASDNQPTTWNAHSTDH